MAKKQKRQNTPKNNPYIVGIVVIVAAALGIMVGTFFDGQGSDEEGQSTTQSGGSTSMSFESISDNPMLGNEDAPVTIIDFSDYSCSYCARHYRQTKPSILSEYVEEGTVRYIWVDFVGVGTSEPHEAAHCVRELGGDEAFWDMNGLIFENQQQVRGNANVLSDLAVQAGVDEAEFTECLDSGKYASLVQESTQLGQQQGIRGTPGFLIGSQDDYELVSGAQPFSAFARVLDAKIALAE